MFKSEIAEIDKKTKQVKDLMQEIIADGWEVLDQLDEVANEMEESGELPDKSEFNSLADMAEGFLEDDEWASISAALENTMTTLEE